MEVKIIFRFVRDCLDSVIHGNRAYHLWMALLTFLVLMGMYAYTVQLDEGLQATGMNDRISWGLYISNFTFFVGVAAAAVMLILPAYVLKDMNFKQAVLIGEGLAVAALCMCLAFVVVDLGGPARAWHLIPVIGYFNWPNSMLAWDVLVLNGYLFINFSIPCYILYCHYKGIEPKKSIYLPGVLISVFWAVGIHMVTAFLYAGLPARPFWNNSLLGPRFLASAFAAGPALIILVLEFVRKYTRFSIEDITLRKISMIVTVAAQINLVMLGSELFKEFYAPTHHSLSAQYLFFGLEGHESLVPWVWTGIALNLVATLMLTIRMFRQNFKMLSLACAMLFVGIWIEKGLGLIIPGFIPGPWGKIVEYTPTWVELVVCVGVLAMGAFIFSALAKIAIRIETGQMLHPSVTKKPLEKVD
ncbi:polysulfide reductase NrfD [bacterium SCSIO 12741]|nr:polysulfide reductase NrfD [bacterium SCSIO 12741]